MSLNRRITGGALLIASFSILCSGGLVYLATSQTITKMAVSELTNIVGTSASMVNQASRHAIVGLLRARAEASRELVAHFYNEYKAGRLTEAEARRRATEVLLAQRIGTSGYIYCLDSHGILRVHPKPGMVGRDVSLIPLSGQQLRSKDHHYIEYDWKNPGEEKSRLKALYQVYFEPWDWVISASSYREEFKDLVHAGDFRTDLLSIKIGQTGYLLLLDAKGNVLVHPTQEGQNMLSLRDGRGREFVKEILARKNGLSDYALSESNNSERREKIAVYKYIPEFNWIVVGTAYKDELFDPLNHIRYMIAAVLFLSCLLALILSAWFGRGVVSSQNAVEMALRSSLEAMSKIIDAVPFALVTVGKDWKVQRANEAAVKILKTTDLIGRNWDSFTSCSCGKDWACSVEETTAVDLPGDMIPILLSAAPVEIGGESICVLAFVDLSERRGLETQLRHAQKLEAVGQLAAGIAHEINTPAQFVTDNVNFLAASFEDLRQLMAAYRQAVDALTTAPGYDALAGQVKEAERGADLEYLQENIPGAFKDALDGISRISTIVRAMKEFAHPDQREKTPEDLNRALQSTLIIAKNEYKYVADIETRLGDLPATMCYLGDINQVFLNLLVNAAHAISDVVGQSGDRGHIVVATMVEGDHVRIDIGDTGSGIPERIRDRIFEPFFTTKEVGRGSGQGLAIARSIVVEKHGGTITFESEVGKGTTFTIRLPIDHSGVDADGNEV